MKSVTLDIETNGVEVKDGIVWVIAVNFGDRIRVQQDCNGIKYIEDWIADLLEDKDVEKIIHNALFDTSFLALNLKRKNGKKINCVNFWCTDITEQVIQGFHPERKLDDDHPLKIAHGTKLSHTLKRYGLVKSMRKDLVFNFVGRPKGIPFTKDETEYYLEDVRYLFSLRKAQEIVLKKSGLYELALLENKFIEVLLNQKIHGIGFDSGEWLRQVKLENKLYLSQLSKLPRTVSNWGSEKQVKDYFKKKGILIESYNMLDKVLFANNDKVLKDFIDMRQTQTQLQKYGLNWLNDGYIWPDNRIRPSVRQIVSTGRNSISNPPMHGLPKKGLKRAAFVPKKGHDFVIGDFSGQELGIMASMANEKIWIDALLRGDDVHSLTASIMYGAEWEKVTEKKCSFPSKCKCRGHVQLREYAKTLNFMLAYGGGSDSFALKTGLSKLDARITVSRYKKVIPSLTKKLEDNAELALDTGVVYSASPYRRKRILYGEKEWHVRNQGKNSPIQMAGADMMKLAAISIPNKYYIAMIWHDELILEVPKKESKAAAKVLKKIMEQSADYITGIKGLIKVDPRIANNLLKK